MRKAFILASLHCGLSLLVGCDSAPSIVRDSASREEELYLEQLQQTVEVEEREHQAKILAKGSGG